MPSRSSRSTAVKRSRPRQRTPNTASAAVRPADWLTVGPQTSVDLSYLIYVDRPGLYLIDFSIPLSEEVQRAVDSVSGADLGATLTQMASTLPSARIVAFIWRRAKDRGGRGRGRHPVERGWPSHIMQRAPPRRESRNDGLDRAAKEHAGGEPVG
jgi:hypothetical protein